MPITVGTYASGAAHPSDAMVLLSGVVLLPGWLIWTSRISGTADA